MLEVCTYAAALNIQPSTVVQRAAKVGGSVWSKWEAGRGSPTLRTADKILKYISDHPPSLVCSNASIAPCTGNEVANG